MEITFFPGPQRAPEVVQFFRERRKIIGKRFAPRLLQGVMWTLARESPGPSAAGIRGSVRYLAIHGYNIKSWSPGGHGSLIAQGDHGIDARGATRRDIAGQETHER